MEAIVRVATPGSAEDEITVQAFAELGIGARVGPGQYLHSQLACYSAWIGMFGSTLFLSVHI